MKAVVYGVGALVAIAVVLMLTPFTSVSPQERGVVVRAAQINKVLEPGWHWRTPILDRVVKMDVSTQKSEVDASAASKDLQSVSAKIAVNFALDPSQVATLYRDFQNEHESRIIAPAVQEAVKAATAKFTADQLITQREAVKVAIIEDLKARLSPRGIIVQDVLITNFDFSSAFNSAVEAKVTAEQNALAEKNNLDASRFKAQAIEVTANAANNDNYIELKRLEVEMAAIEKWNGALPTQFVPGSAMPFINLQSR